MPINITAAGNTGTHTLTRTNVNLLDDYIYLNNPTNVFAGSQLTTLIPAA